MSIWFCFYAICMLFPNKLNGIKRWCWWNVCGDWMLETASLKFTDTINCFVSLRITFIVVWEISQQLDITQSIVWNIFSVVRVGLKTSMRQNHYLEQWSWVDSIAVSLFGWSKQIQNKSSPNTPNCQPGAEETAGRSRELGSGTSSCQFSQVGSPPESFVLIRMNMYLYKFVLYTIFFNIRFNADELGKN